MNNQCYQALGASRVRLRLQNRPSLQNSHAVGIDALVSGRNFWLRTSKSSSINVPDEA
jgi:hypothetical protein